MPEPISPGDARLSLIEGLIRDVADYPKPGIAFKDITPLIGDAVAFRATVDLLAERFEAQQIEAVVGIESRGFIFGAALAYRLGAAFIPTRKPGKLPAQVHRIDYELEYGSDALEMHRDALTPGTRTVICDDLMATGGTARATGDLVRRLGAELVGYAFVVELAFLEGRRRFSDAPVCALVRF